MRRAHIDSRFWVLMVSLGLGLVLAPLPAIATPVLEVDSSGILTGVNDVLVDGSYYDVRFADGTSALPFTVCAMRRTSRSALRHQR